MGNIEKFKGTQGNWKVFPQFNHSQYHVWYKVGRDDGDGYIGESACNITTRDDVRAEANAKLISAAPDLLEALQDLVKYCEDNDNHAELGLAKSAIKKATFN